MLQESRRSKKRLKKLKDYVRFATLEKKQRERRGSRMRKMKGRELGFFAWLSTKRLSELERSRRLNRSQSVLDLKDKLLKRKTCLDSKRDLKLKSSNVED
jgi:hypothetical protein